MPGIDGTKRATGLAGGELTMSNNVNVGRGGGGYVATSPGPLYYARRVVSLLFGVLAVARR
jgi:hypothetical protein